VAAELSLPATRSHVALRHEDRCCDALRSEELEHRLRGIPHKRRRCRRRRGRRSATVSVMLLDHGRHLGIVSVVFDERPPNRWIIRHAIPAMVDAAGVHQVEHGSTPCPSAVSTTRGHQERQYHRQAFIRYRPFEYE